jgi:hypothetical protein
VWRTQMLAHLIREPMCTVCSDRLMQQHAVANSAAGNHSERAASVLTVCKRRQHSRVGALQQGPPVLLVTTDAKQRAGLVCRPRCRRTAV